MRSSPIQVGTGFYRTLALGNNSTMAIDPYGTLTAWGENLYGQAGINSITTYSWTQLSNSPTHSLALRSDGILFAWGLNTSGQLGTGDTINRQSPTQISGSYAQISAGLSNSYAISSDGTLWAWGDNASGQLPSVSQSRSSPVQIGIGTQYSVLIDSNLNQALSVPYTQPTGNFTVEAWVYLTSFAITKTLFWFGSTNNTGRIQFTLNNTGTVGIEIYVTGVVSTTTGTISLNTWAHIAFVRTSTTLVTYINGSSSASIASSGTLGTAGSMFIGNNSLVTNSGASGLYISNVRFVNGTAVYTGNFTVPTSALSTIQSSSTNIVALSGTETVILTCQNDTLIDNSINASTVTDYNTPKPDRLTVPFTQSNTFNSNWSLVSAGKLINYALAIRSNRLYAWGNNANYTLGDGTSITRISPTQIGTSSWSQISAGGSHSLAIDVNNLLYSWGLNTSGQLGLGDTALRSQPTQIGASSWVAISAGYTHSMAITSDNRLFAWGLNTIGQLGFNRSFISLNAGYIVSSVVRSDGTLWAWGNNAQGQLGDGTVVAKSSPVAVGLLTNWSKVTKSTPLNSFAIKTDGTLWGWGENSAGSIGDGTLTNKSSPVQIGASTWTIVATATTSTIGQQATYAITSDGKLYSWGFNDVGQLGLGDTTTRTSPVQVSVGTSWSLVTAGVQYALAITNDGKLYSWGINNAGQLGDPTLATTTNRSTPTILSGSDSWSQVSAGASYVVAIKLDNTVFAWGLNSSGQLGDLSIVSRSSPVQVGTVTSGLTNANAYSLYYNSAISGVRNMTTAASSDWALGTNWTIEFFVSPSTIPSSPDVKWIIYQVGTPGIRIFIDYNPLGTLGFQSDGINARCQTTNSLPLATWTHVAISSIAGTVVIYFNGVVQTLSLNAGNGSYNLTATDGITLFNRPTGGDINTNYNGYISNLRIVKGTGVYTSAFTAPTTPLTAITNTVLLMAQNTTITTDNSGTSKVLTVNGTTPTYSLSTPFPSAVASGALFATQISAGGTHSVAIDTSNKLYAWGRNSEGQLGLNDIASRSAPVQIGFSANWNNISAGDTHTIALDNAGTLYAWGLGTTGQLGDITIVSKSSPVLITSISIPNTSSPTQIGTSSYTVISAGNNFSTAISSDKKLFVWGLGAQGQLGAGLTVARSRPMQISVSNSYNLIGAGGTHLSIVPSTSPQLILTTGLNTSGQLGILSTSSRSSPVQVSASTSSSNSPVTVSVGDYSSYYVSSPTQVGTSSWTSISAGGTHTLGVKKDYTLWAWGYNANGQLADSTTINKSSPVQVGSSSWSQVSAGDLHNIIAKSDGTINTFGLNTFGQLGDGT